MTSQFGERFRRFRRGKGVTQTELARIAQLGERTLGYWEKGERLPRAPELQSALDALKASPAERTELTALLATPRSVKMTRQEIIHAAASELGTLPEIGDLLRAMRLRRGWTQEQMAEETKTRRLTITRWEATQNFPAPETLERICDALNAYPEERQALRERLLFAPTAPPGNSLEEAAEATAQFAYQANRLMTPLVDLSALALKRRLRLLAAQADEALRLLAIVELEHSSWLLFQERAQESRDAIWRSLNGVKGKFPPERFWASALNIAACHADRTAGSNAAAFTLLKGWLPLLPNNYLQTLLLGDMALYASLGGKSDEADALLAAARRSPHIPGKDDGASFLKITEARIQMRTRGVAGEDHLEWLLANSLTTNQRLTYLLMWAESLLEGGDKKAALPYMTRAQAEYTEAVTPKIQQQFAALSRRF